MAGNGKSLCKHRAANLTGQHFDPHQLRQLWRILGGVKLEAEGKAQIGRLLRSLIGESASTSGVKEIDHLHLKVHITITVAVNVGVARNPEAVVEAGAEASAVVDPTQKDQRNIRRRKNQNIDQKAEGRKMTTTENEVARIRKSHPRGIVRNDGTNLIHLMMTLLLLVERTGLM